MKIEHLAQHSDAIPTLAAWAYEEWGHLMRPGTTVEDLCASFEGRTQRHRIPQTFVAVADDEVVGTASLVEHDLPTRRDLSPWLAAVYVAPASRRRGVGSALVEAVVEEASTLGIDTLYLFTPDRMSFYSRLGWRVLERTEHHGREVAIMVYELAS